MRQIIQTRMAPRIVVPSHRKPLATPEDIRESRARQTLRRVLGERRFIHFLKNGFVSVRAKSGKIYLLYGGSGVVRVLKKGKQIETICIQLQGNFPPTDALIMRYLLLVNNEGEFRRLGNVQTSPGSLGRFRVEVDPLKLDLLSEFRRIKVA